MGPHVHRGSPATDARHRRHAPPGRPRRSRWKPPPPCSVPALPSQAPQSRWPTPCLKATRAVSSDQTLGPVIDLATRGTVPACHLGHPRAGRKTLHERHAFVERCPPAVRPATNSSQEQPGSCPAAWRQHLQETKRGFLACSNRRIHANGKRLRRQGFEPRLTRSRIEARESVLQGARPSRYENPGLLSRLRP